MTKSLRSVFVNNRAEQLPDDVWGQFVVPLHFSKLDLGEDIKSVLIEGGRGCGKTMFIRYYSHSTIFSTKRKSLSDRNLSYIGIYWRPDIKFCSFLEKPGWIPDDYKERAFQHLVALSILSDFANAVDSIERANFKNGKISISNLELPEEIKLFFSHQIETLGQIKSYVRKEQSKLDLWSNNPDGNRPTFLKFDDLLERIGQFLSESVPRLQNIFFRVFVDEYENLARSQQRLLNDHIKHPGKFFSLNIATRRNSKIETLTSGSERISEPHDYRRIDLEKEFLEQDGKSSFLMLAAEVLLLRLSNAGYNFDNTVDLDAMFDRTRLHERNTPSYRQKVKSLAREILPQLSTAEIASLTFEDKALRNRLKKLIDKGLKRHKVSNISVSEFLDATIPESSIVCASILNRDSANPNILLQELRNVSKGKSSKLSSDSEWVSNNLTGTLLYLYSGLGKRPCLLYSGFDRYCQIARSNIRFFQEFCHEAFTIYESENLSQISATKVFSVPPRIQAEAAKIASEKLLIGVSDLGWELFYLVRRLGKLFQLAHKRPGQSEPEINHFSISDKMPLEKQEKFDELIEKAKVLSVLYEGKDTKNKGAGDLEASDYFPNPIFAPYFGISYRKIRKITISASEFNVIISGSDDDFEQVVKKYESKWGIDYDAGSQAEMDF